jgi:lambda repressor-like predicted transcriptional regulator
MRKLRKIWRALEGIPGLLAVPEVWRQECGEDFDYARPYLQPTDRIGGRYPCPNSFSGCPRRIIDYGDDVFAAICQDEHQRCERVPLTRREALIHRLDLSGLLQPVLQAAAIRPQSMAQHSPGVWAAGLSEQTHTRNFPVYFLLVHSGSTHRTAVERLLLDISDSFLLVLPTNQFRTVETEDRLRDRRVECLCLEDQVLVDEHGEFRWEGVVETRCAAGEPGPLARSVGGQAAVAAVKEYIQARGLSQTQFSIQAGVSERTLRNFLTNGKMRRSSLDGVAKAMGLSLEQLLRGELPASLKVPRRR